MEVFDIGKIAEQQSLKKALETCCDHPEYADSWLKFGQWLQKWAAKQQAGFNPVAAAVWIETWNDIWFHNSSSISWTEESEELGYPEQWASKAFYAMDTANAAAIEAVRTSIGSDNRAYELARAARTDWLIAMDYHCKTQFIAICNGDEI